MRNFVLLILVACVVSSCNLTNIYIKRTQKTYDQLQVLRWTDKTDSAEIYWRKIGTEGQKVLLIHGFGPLTELQWEGIVKELHKDFVMYIPDLVYFGESTSNSSVFDPRFVARQIETSVRNIEKDPMMVVGFSYGGLISSILAHNAPDMANGLVLIDALSMFFDSAHGDSIANAYGYETVDDILIPEDGKALKTLFKVTFYKPKKYPASMLNKSVEILYGEQREEKRQLLSYLSENEEKLRSSDLGWEGSVHVIWGKNDLLLPVANADRIRDFYDAELTVIPKAGHVVHMEHPQRVAESIRQFANKLSED